MLLPIDHSFPLFHYFWDVGVFPHRNKEQSAWPLKVQPLGFQLIKPCLVMFASGRGAAWYGLLLSSKQ